MLLYSFLDSDSSCLWRIQRHEHEPMQRRGDPWRCGLPLTCRSNASYANHATGSAPIHGCGLFSCSSGAISGPGSLSSHPDTLHAINS